MDSRNQTPDPGSILRAISDRFGEMTPAQVIKTLRSIEDEEKTPARTRTQSAIALRNLGPGAVQLHGFGTQATTLKMNDEVTINPLPVKALPRAEAVRGLRDDAPFVYVSHAISVTFTCSVKTGAHFQIDSRRVGSNRAGSVKLLLEVGLEGGNLQLYRIEPDSVTEFVIDKGVHVRLIGMGVSMNIENQASTSSQQQER